MNTTVKTRNNKCSICGKRAYRKIYSSGINLALCKPHHEKERTLGIFPEINKTYDICWFCHSKGNGDIVVPLEFTVCGRDSLTACEYHENEVRGAAKMLLRMQETLENFGIDNSVELQLAGALFTDYREKQLKSRG